MRLTFALKSMLALLFMFGVQLSQANLSALNSAFISDSILTSSNALVANSSNKKQLKAMAEAISHAQNKAIRKDTTQQDILNLFNWYTDDFVYEHPKYGGAYTREKLLNNSLRFVKEGRYQLVQDRYRITNMIIGLNAVVLEREKLSDGVHHMTLFEFEGNKVKRIKEYW